MPFAILRSISDGDGGETDYQTFAEKAAHQSIEVVLESVSYTHLDVYKRQLT